LINPNRQTDTGDDITPLAEVTTGCTSVKHTGQKLPVLSDQT